MKLFFLAAVVASALVAVCDAGGKGFRGGFGGGFGGPLLVHTAPIIPIHPVPLIGHGGFGHGFGGGLGHGFGGGFGHGFGGGFGHGFGGGFGHGVGAPILIGGPGFGGGFGGGKGFKGRK